MFNIETELSYFDNIKHKILHWAQQFKYVCHLDSCNFKDQFSSYDTLIAVNDVALIETSENNINTDLDKINDPGKWYFGFISYEAMHHNYNIETLNFDGIKMPGLCFFIPELLVLINDNKVIVKTNDRNLYKELENYLISDQTYVYPENEFNSIIYQRIEKNSYLETLEKIKQDILNGCYYEINFCREFYTTYTKLNTLKTYNKLIEIAPSPMSSFVKVNDKYLLSASPERFLKKKNNDLIAQPMKGTIKRSQDKIEDELLKIQLSVSEKDRAENVMIVDLMRNDLTQCSIPGSIEVEELFGLYTFPTVHTMISTIRSKIDTSTHFSDIIKATFPMGSMTGAPKVEVMKYIEKYEKTKRGLYSGIVGYIDPENNFDFNVVIRSILYNKSEQYLSFQTGGAIVYDSDPIDEYEETKLKAKALVSALFHSK